MPILILAFNDAGAFVAMSKTLVLGVAIGYYMNYGWLQRKTNTNISRPLIAYDVSMVTFLEKKSTSFFFFCFKRHAKVFSNFSKLFFDFLK